MSKESAVNQARSDFQQGGKGANTNGWNSNERNAYDAELARLKQQASESSSKK